MPAVAAEPMSTDLVTAELILEDGDVFRGGSSWRLCGVSQCLEGPVAWGPTMRASSIYDTL